MPDGPRYDDDFYAWTQHQAQVLRGLRTADNRFDRAHVAEEIEDLGKSERDAVESQLVRVVEHLLKLSYSQSERPRFGWMRSIADARRVLKQKLTPTLRRIVEAEWIELYRHARLQAELGLREYDEEAAAEALPAECPYPPDQILQDDWYPDPPARDV